MDKRMKISEAIDKIAELAIESDDYEIIVSSTAALKTLGILQDLGFEKITIDEHNNM